MLATGGSRCLSRPRICSTPHSTPTCTLYIFTRRHNVFRYPSSSPPSDHPGSRGRNDRRTGDITDICGPVEELHPNQRTSQSGQRELRGSANSTARIFLFKIRARIRPFFLQFGCRQLGDTNRLSVLAQWQKLGTAVGRTVPPRVAAAPVRVRSIGGHLSAN